jgi:hypothetical protein
MFRATRHISQPPRGHTLNTLVRNGMPAEKRAKETSYICPTDLKPKTSSLKTILPQTIQGKSKKAKVKSKKNEIGPTIAF